MLLVAFQHGLRVGEVTEIKREDIQGGHLFVQRLKGSRATTQQLLSDENPLLDEKTALFDFIRNLAPNQKLFPISERHANRLILRYGTSVGLHPERCHMHTLKHSCAKYLRSQGVDLPVIQAWLGHVSLGSTGVYLGVSDDEAAEAIRKARGGSEKV